RGWGRGGHGPRQQRARSGGTEKAKHYREPERRRRKSAPCRPSVIGNTNLSASHASAAIAEIDFDGNDTGKWPENIDSNIRLLLVQRSPEVVQHINKDFTKEPTISRSVQSDTDAITSKVLSRRRLMQEWFYRTLINGEKVLSTWMAYSPSKASLFCFCWNKVWQEIIAQIKKAKYYSMIFESTPNIAHKDQTSQVLRYVMIDNQILLKRKAKLQK
ncbi:hypothetical protein ILUMI_17969, partial [Ignelater luminosus]